VIALARLIRIAAGLAAALIVAGILLFLFSANSHNGVVSDIHSAAAWIVGPFKGMFSIGGRKANLALNWGIAAVVYLAVGHLLASLLARAPARTVGRVRPVA
jgi:hypothetical protein